MNKKKTVYIALLISVLCIVLISLTALMVHFAAPHILKGFSNLITSPEKSFNKEIVSIASESDELPYVAAYGSLYKGNEIISLYDLCEEQNMEYQNALCIFDNKVYFICTEPSGANSYWSLNSIDLITLDEQECFRFEMPQTAYNRYANSVKYIERNGYCINGKIVLNDFTSVWEYDLELALATKYTYDKYVFPNCDVYGEYVDKETIKVHTELAEKTFTFYDMSQKSVGISTVYSFKERMNRENKPYITDFFNNRSVQYVNGKIYAIGECRDNTGGAYAIVLEYDEENGKWIYTGSVYTWDTAIYTYIVPVYQGNG